MISLCSTLSLDALSADKPIINTAYRSFYDTKGQDISHLPYLRDFYTPLLEEEAIDLVKSEEELVNSVNLYLRDPARKRANRARARDRLCYKVDGQSSRRLAEALISLL